MKNVFLIAVFSLFLAGCKTVPIQDRAPIRVPSNLNDSHVEAAILITLGSHSAGESSLSNWQMITDNALRSALKHYSSADRSGNERYWYFEEKGPNVVYVGFMKNELYMKVALHYDNHQIKSEIVESKNFRQTQTEIHKHAYMYLQEFEDRLQRSIGDVSRLVTYGGVEPEKVANLPPPKVQPAK